MKALIYVKIIEKIPKFIKKEEIVVKFQKKKIPKKIKRMKWAKNTG